MVPYYYATILNTRGWVQKMLVLAEFCTAIGQLTPLVVMYSAEHAEVHRRQVQSRLGPFML